MALLDGLLHCYTPSLGPTGYRLIDRGPRRIHGVAIAGISATAWQGAAGGKWSLRDVGTGFSGCGNAPATSARTVIAWFATTQTSATSKVIYNVAGSTGEEFAIYQGLSAGVSGVGVTQNGDSVNATGYQDGTWHMIGVVNVGTLWTLFFNGREITSKTMTTNALSGPATIGAYNSSGILPWIGGIGEIASFTRAVTSAEQMELYRDGDGAIGRMLNGQAFGKRRLSQSIAAGGVTPWLYARRRSQVIGSGGVH